MTETSRSCFVIMPFREEFHFFYLYLRRHIEEKHGVTCRRGDADILTVPLLEKINDYIRNADVLIADCSGRNPNVFYELGMAHALGKKVILITKDPVAEAPTDIRHMEFIQYNLGNHVDFLEKLDNALHRVFIDRYEELYDAAVDLFTEFRQDTNARIEIAPKELFVERVAAAGRTQDLPLATDRLSVMEFALPRVISDNNDFGVMIQLTQWITSKLEERS